MKSLHLINKKEENSNKRKGINSVKGEPGVFMSCCWDFDLSEEAKHAGALNRRATTSKLEKII